MKTQILKALSLASLVIALSVPSIYAGIPVPIKVSVPFAFMVGNQMLPAGDYTVSTIARYTLKVQSVDRKIATTVLINDKLAKQVQKQTKVAFRRYENRYFLTQVWTIGDDAGYEVPLGRAERELIKDSSKHLAQKASGPELIYIVAE